MNPQDSLDDQTLLAQARLAGLETAVVLAPDDVLVAARVVQALRAQFKPCDDPTVEPVPTFTVRG